jgi:hypothetical protein
MAGTNDAMYTALMAMYPEAGDTLADLLYTHWNTVGLQYRGSLQFDYYVAQGASGSTWGDVANTFWNDGDFVVSNLELETGSDLLLEDGGFVLLEAGNG